MFALAVRANNNESGQDTKHREAVRGERRTKAGGSAPALSTEAPFDWHRPREHVRIINESPGNHICLEMIPHPRCRGDWFLKPSWGAPSGLWYRERQFAVSYAEWLAREAERAEIRVYNQDGSLSESRVVGRAAQLGENNWAINSSANRELPGVGPLQHAYIECLGRASGRARNSRQARCVGTGEAASG